jgi:DNA-binding transcriptional MocR family regulator
MKHSSSPLLYQTISERLFQMIHQGTFRAGERIPSVRKLSEQFQVSISTILEAYRLLEDRGIIEARPQSGFYVRPRSWQPPAEPKVSDPPSTPSLVTVGDLVMQVIHAANDPNMIQFGTVVPAPELLPTRQLNRIMSVIGRRQPHKSNSYDFPPGNKSLRIQVARRSIETGCTLTPEDLVTTCGSQEAVSLCLRAVAKPGDIIAIESPTFYGILQAIEQFGMRALEIPTHPREGINLDALRFAIEHKKIKACLFVLNFNNPLGSCMPDENKKKLVSLLNEYDIPLIEDDVYGDLFFGAKRPKVAKAFDNEDRVLLCSSFSKTLAPGYRVGWVAPGKRYKEEIERLKFVSSVATATLPQMAIAEFLENGGYDHYLRKVRRIYAEQIQRMTECITINFPEGTKITRPQGGFVLWVELPGKIDSLLLHKRALKEKINIAPGPLFSPQQKYKNFIRINCGHLWSEKIEQGLMTLGRLAKT